MVRVQWHLVMTHPKREAHAMNWLRRQLIESFCPMWTKRYQRVRNGKVISTMMRSLPVFPGYVFVARPDVVERFTRAMRGVNLSNDHLPVRMVEILADIEATSGVIGFVRADGVPLVVKAELVAHLRELMMLGCFVEDPKTGAARIVLPGALPDEPEAERFKLGDFVRVVDGPFDGFSGRLEEKIALGRMSVEMDMFGRKTRVEMDMTQLEPLPAPRESAINLVHSH